jgi:hypothetical protein
LVTYSTCPTGERPIALAALAHRAVTPNTANIRTITRLFDVADPELVGCLNGRCDRLYCRLDRSKALCIENDLDEALELYGLSNVQAANVVITRLWLLSRLWQACVSHALLESCATSGILYIRFPLVLLDETLKCLSVYDDDAMKGNGRCIVSGRIFHCHAGPRLIPGLQATRNSQRVRAHCCAPSTDCFFQ